MKSRTFFTAILAVFLFIGVAACGNNVSTPETSVPTATAVTDMIPLTEATTATSSDLPATTEPVAPTDSPETEPTVAATAVPTQPVSYTITVNSPQPNQAITVAREFTFSGSVSPVPSQRLEIELVPSGNTNGNNLLTFVDVDSATGNWSVTSLIPPRRTGPAVLHVRAAGADVTVPIQLQFAQDETSTIVTVNQPLARQVVVAGQTLLISGESRNLIDGKIQVGLFGCPTDTDENLVVNIVFSAGNGTWRAQIIIPETAAANCDTARLRVTTGGLTSNDPQVAWASDQLLTLVTPNDKRANIFTIWESTQLRFVSGQATNVMGTAVNAVDGLLRVELLQNDQVLTSITVAPDLFGYWETSLTPPTDTEPGEIQLRLSTGTDDTFRELILPTSLGS